MKRFHLQYDAHLHNHSLCTQPSILHGVDGEVVEVTRGRMWRYFSLIACGGGIGNHASWRHCLVCKENVVSPTMLHMHSFDGLEFSKAAPLFPRTTSFAQDERVIVHNLAVLGHRRDYILVGGMGPRNLVASDKASGAQLDGIRLSRGGTWPLVDATDAATLPTRLAHKRCQRRRPQRISRRGPSGVSRCHPRSRR